MYVQESCNTNPFPVTSTHLYDTLYLLLPHFIRTALFWVRLRSKSQRSIYLRPTLWWVIISTTWARSLHGLCWGLSALIQIPDGFIELRLNKIHRLRFLFFYQLCSSRFVLWPLALVDSGYRHSQLHEWYEFELWWKYSSSVKWIVPLYKTIFEACSLVSTEFSFIEHTLSLAESDLANSFYFVHPNITRTLGLIKKIYRSAVQICEYTGCNWTPKTNFHHAFLRSE